jgi:hypothetical protein
MEYPVLARKLRASGGLAGSLLSYLSDWDKEEVLLDWNEIAEKFGMCFSTLSSLLCLACSPHTHIRYCIVSYILIIIFLQLILSIASLLLTINFS